MKPTWIQKGADIAKNINTEWGMTLKSIPFKAFPDMKEVFTREWVEQSGEEEYLPATPVFKSYEMDVQFVYLGALDTAGEKIFKFCEYMAGSEVSLYDEFTKVGCRCRFVSYDEKAFYRRDEDAVQFSIKVKVNNPLCYAAKSNGLSEIRFAVPVKTVVYWSDGTATMHDASSTVAKTINGFGIVAPYSSAIAPATQVITPTPSQNGYTFTPHISPDGVLTFTNDGNLTNPNPLQLFSANKAVTDSITPDDLTKWNSVVGKENAGVAAQLVSDLKSGVSSEGDTLKKLYDLFVSAYSEVTVASISARDAYDIKKLPTSIFVLDDGDGKWALYKATTTGTNASYVKISDPDLLNATMTASQIKASYESVANAFTDAEKQKLAQQSGTNTGDQDLSGLEPKRGADDFYVTNAEKTQGALATGNTILPTVKDVADAVANMLPKPPEEEDLYSYGVLIDTRVALPILQRVGSSDLGKTQPIVNNFRACILKDDGTINYYLDSSDITKKLDGSNALLDGTDGQIMIEIPDMWRSIKTIDTYRTEIRFSPYEIIGFEKIEGFYYSPVLASVHRPTNKLSSVINASVDYRGGNNDATRDANANTQLGMCATALSRTQFRNYAQNMGIKYIGSTYHMNEVLLQLYWCEYANLNMQDAYIGSLTADGYRQGGLGIGVTTINGTNWNTFNGYYPLIPNGVGFQSVGVNTGIKNYTISGLGVSVDIPVWHGIENIFGHMWQSEDGVNIEIQAANSGALSKAWICNKIRFFADTITSEYACVGNIPRVEGWVTQMIKGTILPLAVGGSSNTYYCDYSSAIIHATGVSIRQVFRGGSAYSGSAAGLGYSNSNNAPSAVNAQVASRLCAVKSL